MRSVITEMTALGGLSIIGHYSGRLAKRLRLPSLVGYMVLGIALGPSLLNIFSVEMSHRLEFVTEVALGFVAFSIGSELNLSSLKQLGSGIVSIILAESFGAFIIVSSIIYLLTRNMPLSLIFGSVAPASAPAGTVAVIQEYKAKGNLTKALYAVVGFDDGLAIVIFAFATAVAKILLLRQVSSAETSILASMLAPLQEIIMSLAVGGIAGLVFCLLLSGKRDKSFILTVFMGTVLTCSGLAAQFHLSLILTNLAAGMVLTNTRREEFVHRVTEPLRYLMPYTFILFFGLAGAHLKLSSLPSLGVLGLTYIVARSAGLVLGARVGAAFGAVEDKIKKYIGLGILSQAGVAIGLSLIIQQEFNALAARFPAAFAKVASHDPLLHPATIGATVITTITATCVVFEVIGPILTKYALTKAGEINAS